MTTIKVNTACLIHSLRLCWNPDWPSPALAIPSESYRSFSSKIVTVIWGLLLVISHQT